MQYYLIIGALLFVIGLFLLLTRKNAIMALMGIELMLNAANVNFVGFSHFRQNIDGQMATLFIIALAAAETAIALAIILILYKQFNTINVEEADELNG
jgi:NADH-quinone oxidoreductase subunit K